MFPPALGTRAAPRAARTRPLSPGAIPGTSRSGRRAPLLTSLSLPSPEVFAVGQRADGRAHGGQRRAQETDGRAAARSHPVSGPRAAGDLSSSFPVHLRLRVGFSLGPQFLDRGGRLCPSFAERGLLSRGFLPRSARLGLVTACVAAGGSSAGGTCGWPGGLFSAFTACEWLPERRAAGRSAAWSPARRQHRPRPGLGSGRPRSRGAWTRDALALARGYVLGKAAVVGQVSQRPLSTTPGPLGSRSRR